MIIRGKCSFFGGPNDKGVSSSEGLALVEPSELSKCQFAGLFLPSQPPGTTGLARRLNPDSLYCAMRWDYKQTSRAVLQNSLVRVTNESTGATANLTPIDWGPHVDTKRVIDMSDGAGRLLGVRTDDSITAELLINAGGCLPGKIVARGVDIASGFMAALSSPPPPVIDYSPIEVSAPGKQFVTVSSHGTLQTALAALSRYLSQVGTGQVVLLCLGLALFSIVVLF